MICFPGYKYGIYPVQNECMKPFVSKLFRGTCVSQIRSHLIYFPNSNDWYIIIMFTIVSDYYFT